MAIKNAPKNIETAMVSKSAKGVIAVILLEFYLFQKAPGFGDTSFFTITSVKSIIASSAVSLLLNRILYPG